MSKKGTHVFMSLWRMSSVYFFWAAKGHRFMWTGMIRRDHKLWNWAKFLGKNKTWVISPWTRKDVGICYALYYFSLGLLMHLVKLHATPQIEVSSEVPTALYPQGLHPRHA